MSNENKPPVWFWIIAVLALIWNIMGVLAYLGQAFATPEALSAMPEHDQNYYANMPAWVTGAFAISVFAGVLGCLGLVLRKKWATMLLTLSLLAVLAQATYNFFIQTDIDLAGARMAMPIVIIIVALLLVMLSRTATKKGWIS